MASARRSYQLLNAEAAAASSSAVMPVLSENIAGAYQLVVGTAVTTLVLEGRSAPDAPWVTLVASVTATGEGSIPRMMPEMRVTWTGNTGVLDYWIVA